MKIGIILRGISHGNGKADFRICLDNIQENVIKPLSETNEISTYLCTYEHSFLDELNAAYQPKKTEILSFSGSNQISTFIHSLKMLREEDLDFVVVGRFDLWFNQKITETNIDYDKFNFVFKLSPIEAPFEKFEFVSDLGMFFNYRYLEYIIQAAEYLLSNPPRPFIDLHGIYKSLKKFMPEDHIHFMTPVIWRKQGDEYPLYDLKR
jgi:hypothetical protein